MLIGVDRGLLPAAAPLQSGIKDSRIGLSRETWRRTLVAAERAITRVRGPRGKMSGGKVRAGRWRRINPMRRAIDGTTPGWPPHVGPSLPGDLTTGQVW